MDFMALLDAGVDRWNQWRSLHPTVPCTLAGKDLSGGYFFECDLSGVNLQGANLQRACLIGADLRWADLTGADLRGAYLGEANFYGAKLNDTDFTDASMERADLRRVHRAGRQMADGGDRMAKMSPTVAKAAALASTKRGARNAVQIIERPITVGQHRKRGWKRGLSSVWLRLSGQRVS